MEHLVNTMLGLLHGVNSNIAIFIISMIPILELRGGMIAAAVLKVPVVRAVIICMVGNILPIPFILLFITRIFDWLKGTKLFKPMVQKLEAKAMGKSDSIKKREFIGLLLFVGIPLPGTGAWTGSLIAALLGVKLKKSIPAILCGIVLATVIMCIVTYLIPALI
jgi:uncharacterized membrane protein